MQQIARDRARARESRCSDLVRLSSCHGHDAADALGNGLLRDDGEGSGVSRVLQVTGGRERDKDGQRDRQRLILHVSKTHPHHSEKEVSEGVCDKEK